MFSLSTQDACLHSGAVDDSLVGIDPVIRLLVVEGILDELRALVMYAELPVHHSQRLGQLASRVYKAATSSTAEPTEQPSGRAWC